MFQHFFHELRSAKIPVTLKEYLSLLEAMDKGAIGNDVTDFYYLARTALVKDEKHLDKFDRVFGHVFKGLEAVDTGMDAAGVENAMAILKKINRERRKTIFLISHRDELSSRVTNVLRVVKENGYTSFSMSEE